MPSVSDAERNGTLPGHRTQQEDITARNAGRSGKKKGVRNAGNNECY